MTRTSFQKTYAFFAVIDFRNFHSNEFGFGGRYVFSDVIGTNRKFAMSAVNEYGKLYACGSSACRCRIQGSPCRAARIKNIIDKNHIHTINTKRNIASGNHRIGLNFAQVVTIEGDIKLAYGNGYPLDCFYVFRKCMFKRNASAPYS